MIYNFNLGIGWASSGVEYAQAYRAKMLRHIGAPAKFVFTDMFPEENMEHMTANIGFLDSEVIWMYQSFTDFETSPTTFTLEDLEKTFSREAASVVRKDRMVQYIFAGRNNFCTAHLVSAGKNLVERVENIENGYLVRTDHYTTGRLFSEYFAPLDGEAHRYLRRYFNRDGSTAFDEIEDDGSVMYQFSDAILYSKEELVGYFVRNLNLGADDVVIIDRTTGIGQSILMNKGPARVGVVIHADHFSEEKTDERHILWNNYYEYDFAMHRHIDFYIASTDEQNKLVVEQFRKYVGATPRVVTIPVGGLTCLKRPLVNRKPYSLISASRLASEKHLDWVIEAVAIARAVVPQVSLDIYGRGAEADRLARLIESLGAGSYIKLRGQCDLRNVYQEYEAYVAGSTSEGFGLSLMEAVGGGLPIIGFDVRYGNPTFIDDGENGYLIDYDSDAPVSQHVEDLAECIVRLFQKPSLDEFHEHSYEIAGQYLTEEVEKRWKSLVM